MNEKIVSSCFVNKDGQAFECVQIQETRFHLTVLRQGQWTWIGEWSDSHIAAQVGTLMLDAISVTGFQVEPRVASRFEYRPAAIVEEAKAA